MIDALSIGMAVAAIIVTAYIIVTTIRTDRLNADTARLNDESERLLAEARALNADSWRQLDEARRRLGLDREDA